MKNLWTKDLRSPANGAAANMQIAEDTSGWEHFSAQFWFAWIQYVMLCVGLSAISWPGPGPGPVTKHTNQYRGLWTPGPWLLTPTSLTQASLRSVVASRQDSSLTHCLSLCACFLVHHPPMSCEAGSGGRPPPQVWLPRPRLARVSKYTLISSEQTGK